MKRIFLLIIIAFACVRSYGQLLQTLTIEHWQNSAWVNANLFSYTYDNNNYKTGMLGTNWNAGTGSWENAVQINYANNNDGTVSQSVGQNWSTTTQTWNNGTKITYTYNSAAKVTVILNETWNNNTWTNSSKQTYTYDANGYETNMLNQGWDAVNSIWNNIQQTAFTNNSDGTVNQAIFQNWNSSTASWVTGGRSTYTYTPAGKVAGCLSENLTGGIWVNSMKLTYTYDAANYQLSFLEEGWSPANSQWWSGILSNNDNNSDGTVHQSVSQYRDSATAPWVTTGRATYTYSNTAGIATVNDDDIRLFPNPCNGSITVHLSDKQPATAMVLDNTGRPMLTASIAGSESTVNVSKLPAGTYVLLVSAGRQQKTARFVKQ